MTVQDDGVGLPNDQTIEVVMQGMGLRTMRARANLIGATITFEKNSLTGTTVRVTWPTT